MFGPDAGARVMVATRPVDFRKGPDALDALVGKEYGVCGRPDKCKRDLASEWACGRVLTCVRPHKATSTRRGPLSNS